MAQSAINPAAVRRLKEAVLAHPGPTEVHLHVRNLEKTTVFRLGPRVAAGPGLWADLKAAAAVRRLV
ncbi:hypothetical protein E1265_08945 [Streptomyces sp. 8K308]|uniref:hypothetical protein n=1 Tax=Streptomyces sp. 8K308 TaxID=2530388 RepID=UPI001049E47C|nr:hypothetical protein [Streptomyces sp. 8K308]TDC24721.1 hypothetical protein E1265_08945 [Streptomyces sp. 8K308]